MATVDFSRFAIQAVDKITWLDLEDNNLLALLNDPKNCNININGEIVYATGGKGNPRVASFGHSKTVEITASSATFETGALSNSFGSATPVVGATSGVFKTEVLTVSAGNTVTTTHTPVVRTDATYVSYARKQNNDESLGATYTESDTANVGYFTVSGKTLTFNASDVDEGDKIVVCYNYLAGSTTSLSKVQSDKFAKSVKCIIDAYVKNVCTDEDFAAQFVIPKMKLAEEVSFEIDNAGDPAMYNISGFGLKPCGSKDLLEFYIIDEDNAT